MKKLLSLLLSVLLLCSLCACGGTAEPVETEPFVWYHTGPVEVSQRTLEDAAEADYVQPKNVILMIADGMGVNDIENARNFAEDKFSYGLAMDFLPARGTCTTHSDSSDVTDSAAAATALATGVKTTNSFVGMDPDGQPVKNVCEVAREQGKKIGVVTNDDMTGATPSGFLVHHNSRDDTVALWDQMVAAGPDVLIGNGEYAMREIGLSENSLAALDNYLVAPNFSKFTTVLDKDPEKPFYGFLASNVYESDNFLAYSTEIALNRLENEKGFFLMVEGCGTDKSGHKNNLEGKLSSVVTFDRAVAVAMAYCLKHPDTVLIITADHECGGVSLPADRATKDTITFSTTDHTGQDVVLLALGYGTQQFHGQVSDNTDIAKFMMELLQQ